MRWRAFIVISAIVAVSSATLVVLRFGSPGHCASNTGLGARPTAIGQSENREMGDVAMIAVAVLRGEIERYVRDGDDDNEAYGLEDVRVYIREGLVSTWEYSEIQRRCPANEVNLAFVGWGEFTRRISEPAGSFGNLLAITQVCMGGGGSVARVVCQRRVHSDDQQVIEHHLTKSGQAWVLKQGAQQ